MSTSYDDKNNNSVSGMLSGDPSGDNDIQIINRDEQDPYDGNIGTTNLDTPPALRDVLYNDYQDYPNMDQQHTGIHSYSGGGSNQYRDDDTRNFGREDRQLTTLGHNKYLNVMPQMTPLSESVLPGGFNMPPLALSNLNKEDMKERKPALPKPKKENPGLKRTAFVPKMWSMVNDPANKDYIRWNDDGKTFQVFHREEFMKNILPKYFKHNNFASFVRQLNMYGWHKVQDISSGTLNQSKDDKNSDEVLQFENPYFIQGRKDLLDKIVRNKSVNQENESSDNNQVNLNLILNELDQIKRHQMAINEDLRRVRKDNKTLWQENFITREKHQQQANTLDKILKFLAAVYGNNNKILDNSSNTFFDEQGNQVSYNGYNGQQGNQYNPYATQAPSPYHRPRLMLTNQAHKRSPSVTESVNSNQHRDSNGSIEEIIKNYEKNPTSSEVHANQNVNRIYNQIINPEQAPSPRQFFPELTRPNNPGSPYIPGTPGQQFLGIGSPITLANLPNSNDFMTGLEQNIYRQGQSILQVQDWIQKLANQQQQQQASLSEIHDDIKQDLDDFDVNEFLNSSNGVNAPSGSTTPGGSTVSTANPVVVTPGDTSSESSRNATSSRNKRPASEVFDGSDVTNMQPTAKPATDSRSSLLSTIPTPVLNTNTNGPSEGDSATLAASGTPDKSKVNSSNNASNIQVSDDNSNGGTPVASASSTGRIPNQLTKPCQTPETTSNRSTRLRKRAS